MKWSVFPETNYELRARFNLYMNDDSVRIIEENRLLAEVNDELCVTIYNKYKNVWDEIFDTVKNEIPHLW